MSDQLKTPWPHALAISNVPAVHEALETLCSDPSEDNAVCAIQSILDAAPQQPAQDGGDAVTRERELYEALLMARDHIDMHTLGISHCKDHAQIAAAIAAPQAQGVAAKAETAPLWMLLTGDDVALLIEKHRASCSKDTETFKNEAIAELIREAFELVGARTWASPASPALAIEMLVAAGHVTREKADQALSQAGATTFSEPAAQIVETCGACLGSGETTALSGGGPDAFEVSGLCDPCKGSGAVAQPEALPPGVFSAAQPMNKWVPESDASILRRVGKTGEEAAELAKVCFRIVIQGLDGIDPTSGKTNRQCLQDELADVLAQTELTVEQFNLHDGAMADRVLRKTAQMHEWESLFQGDEASGNQSHASSQADQGGAP